MILKHDKKLEIAIAPSSGSALYKNKVMYWSEIVEKLSQTHYTHETVKEYADYNKALQDKIKNIGGFVGGYLAGGKRKKDTISFRSIVSMDMDFGEPGVWDCFTLMNDFAACTHSTHKHTSEKPRLRIIIPLDRHVTPEEYQAIGRRIAGDLDIELFDNTGFQPERMMYWPSTSKDGEYFFANQDGPILNADSILSQYINWKDVSEWPVSERHKGLIARAMKKQGDPLEKPGMLGAFCRVYSVTDVLSLFLAEIYDPTDLEDRYSFKAGSTSGGLVLYEDKFAYSHHNTDPAGNRLSNAFDLVRLHLFSDKDENTEPGTPINRYPSYEAMLEYCSRDPEVRKLIATERRNSALEDFAHILDQKDDEPETEAAVTPGEPENNDWMAELDTDKKGNAQSTIQNVLLILKSDPVLAGAFAYDEFECQEVITRSVPWRKVKKGGEQITDNDMAGLRHYLENAYGISSSPKIEDGFSLCIHANTFHPIKKYLDSLSWDGTPRIETLLTDYLGAEDTPLNRAFSRKTLTAAVKRIHEPGCKFDTVLTLIGDEGKGKSFLFRALGGSWFSDSFNTVIGREAFEALQGRWLIEIAELAGLRRSESEAQKHYLSKQDDSYRPAYGRRVEKRLRQCIFIGTTNRRDFLVSKDGNRRFWPVECEVVECIYDVFTDITPEVRNQIWAEAVKFYRAGEQIFLTGDLKAQAKEHQSAHMEHDDRFEEVQKYLDTRLPEDWYRRSNYDRRGWLVNDDIKAVGVMLRNRISVAEIWYELFGGSLRDMTAFNTKSIHDIMRNMPGWKNAGHKRFGEYGTQKAYEREEFKIFSINT